MNKEEIFNVLDDKEKFDVYKKFQQIENSIDESDELYKYFDMFKEMLLSDKVSVRMRSFRIICKLSKWDKENKINKIIDQLLSVLDSDRPTDIRICLSYLNNLLLYKVELNDKIENKLKKIDYSKFKDSMSPLIKKDIDYILEHL